MLLGLAVLWLGVAGGRKREYQSITGCETACRGDRDSDCAATSPNVAVAKFVALLLLENVSLFGTRRFETFGSERV